MMENISLKKSLRPPQRPFDRAALTLPEILITIILSSLILGVCLFIMTTGFESWQSINIQSHHQQELRKAA